jgi:excisionase family DNA binding protein
MVQYYTLEQAAQILRTSPEKLKEMAKKNEVRAFQDRGTWRFRSQEIDELARKMGLGSDAEIPLGEAGAMPPASSSSSGRRTSAKPAEDSFNLSLDDDGDAVPLGADPAPSRTGSRSGSPRTPSGGRSGSKSPPPKASSDSDVRLVMDSSDLDFQIDLGSDAKLAKDPVSPSPKPARRSRLGPGSAEHVDSGVRMVPLEGSSDSDVKIAPDSSDEDAIPGPTNKTASDSDIRLEELDVPPRKPPRSNPVITEEIDLDAEARQAPPRSRAPRTQHRPLPPGGPALPTSSPFELSEADLDLDNPPPGPATPAPVTGGTDDSSDFELTPMSDSGLSPLEPSSDETPALLGDDEVSLGELSGGKGHSGINLQEPADGGISLEQGGSDEIEFELSLEGGTTPKPADAKDKDSSSDFELSLNEGDSTDSSSDFEIGLQDDSSPTSDSEFELSLQDDEMSPQADSDSEFELSLDADSSSVVLEGGDAPALREEESDSEFELTLDDSGGLQPAADDSDDQEAFETEDFDVPEMDEESGSEAVALDEADTDLESSDFDLSLEGGDEESGSQVVPLEDEEEYDESGATVQRQAADLEEGEEGEAGFDDLDADLDAEAEGEEEAEAEEEEEGAVAAAPAPAPAARPASWGVLPALLLMPSAIILFLVGIMSFELIQGMWGYHKSTRVSNLIIHPIAKMLDDSLPEP